MRDLETRLKAGATIIVRAKNGHCWPPFMRKPSAYRSKIGKDAVASGLVRDLCSRRIIKTVTPGWYSEGHFRWNDDLRDTRGRFRRRT